MLKLDEFYEVRSDFEQNLQCREVLENCKGYSSFHKIVENIFGHNSCSLDFLELLELDLQHYYTSYWKRFQKKLSSLKTFHRLFVEQRTSLVIFQHLSTLQILVEIRSHFIELGELKRFCYLT